MAGTETQAAARYMPVIVTPAPKKRQPSRIVTPSITPKQARFCVWAKALAPKE
jgi:hypothetical protein